MRWGGLAGRALDALAMAFVAGLSFLLLLYVGHGEAQRSFERFHLDKLAAQGRMLQGAIEGYLRRDLPLSQYVGFRPRAERLRASDDQLLALAVHGADGTLLFASGDPGIGLLPMTPQASRIAIDVGEVHKDDRYLQLVLPLANRYERVGDLVLTAGWTAIDRDVKSHFQPLVYLAAGLSLLFALTVAAARDWLVRQRLPWLQVLYSSLFMVMAGAVITAMVQLYSRGAQLEAEALADSLGQRMTEIMGFHLDLQQLQGLDRTFGEYRRLNPDIGAVALVVDGRIAIHTDPFMVGRPWSSDASTYEYRVDVTPPGSTQQVGVAVTLPEDIVYGRILRNAKNFLALFVASAFLANLFLQLARTLRRPDRPVAAADGDRALALVKPVFYVAMCVEHLIYPFLPQHVQGELAAAALPESLAGLVVTTYYLVFALTLVPASHLTQRFGSRRPMAIGLLLTAIGLLALVLPGSLLPLLLGRACAGIGQALLLIGVQSYILAVAAPERRTQGAAIIVFGFQGGMIAGMAIGSLLVISLGPDGVFVLGALIAALTAFYASIMIPAETGGAPVAGGLAGTWARLGSDLGQALRSRSLIATIGLVGVPAKAVLTGVVVFALPLLMTEQGYRQEDIGQMLMIYAGAVIVASSTIARLVDRTGTTGLVLGVGGVLSGLGLLLIALVDSDALGHGGYSAVLQVLLLGLGILVVGGAHGLINAPIVTHVAELDLARRIGAGAATAAYRFLERIGHVAGPLLIGQLVLLAGHIGTTLRWVGLAVALLGLAFLGLQHRRLADGRPARRADELLGLHLDPPDLAFLVAVDEGEPAMAGRRTERMLRAASRSGTGAEDPDRVRGLRAFLAPILATVPTTSRLRLVGCGDPASYRAVLAQAPMVELRLVPGPGAWLEELRQHLAATRPDAAAGRSRPAEELARALADHRRQPIPADRPFVWLRSPAATRQPAEAPVAVA